MGAAMKATERHAQAKVLLSERGNDTEQAP